MGDQSKCVPATDGAVTDGAAADGTSAESYPDSAMATDALADGGTGGSIGTDAEGGDIGPDLPAPVDADASDVAAADVPGDKPAVDSAPNQDSGSEPVGAVCGDRVVTSPEECDLGTAMNTGAYGGCTSTCKLAAHCGDGAKNGPERCDNGSVNNDSLYNGCKTNCTLGPHCGDAHQDPGEDCDLGAANSANAYGKGMCTVTCKAAPFCGDGQTNGREVCDNGGTGATDLGACNPECTGYYEKKTLRATTTFYTGNLGGPAGADTLCQMELGAGWKAVLVGGSRRATTTPFKGDGQDWVLHKYTHYFNESGQLIWRNDEIPLIGVHNGQQQDTYVRAFMPGNYPWAGWAKDWTTLPDISANAQGTCQGWASGSSADWGNFALPNLMSSQSETCGSMSFLLCAEQ